MNQTVTNIILKINDSFWKYKQNPNINYYYKHEYTMLIVLVLDWKKIKITRSMKLNIKRTKRENSTWCVYGNWISRIESAGVEVINL